MDRVKISEIYKDVMKYNEVKVCGFIRNLRDSKNIAFIELNDGSNFKSIQVVVNNNITNFNDIVSLNIGSCVEVIGNVILTPNAKQPFE
ncbi:MAG: OB-fold nucleic acid binding domain-containing protein, partial [Clostridia bacterium]